MENHVATLNEHRTYFTSLSLFFFYMKDIRKELEQTEERALIFEKKCLALEEERKLLQSNKLYEEENSRYVFLLLSSSNVLNLL